MAQQNNQEIMDDFSKDMMEGSGDLSSELDDKKRILTFIRTLNVINAQNNPDISLKINLLDSLWEELEINSEEETTNKVNKILTEMNPFKIRYSRLVRKGIQPKPKTVSQLFSSTHKYTFVLRKESHRQLNLKGDNKNG